MADSPVPPFFTLPPELIQQVLGYLSLSDLLSVGLVNHALHDHSLEDLLYQPLVQENVPGNTLAKPKDSTWRELYMTHHPYWFIPRQKIWFSDNVHTGKLLIARYNHRANAIEGYALVAERRQPTLLTWDWNTEAIIHTFSPKIQLDLNVPILRLESTAYENAVAGPGYRLQREIPMNLFDYLSGWPTSGVNSRLMLTKPWPSAITTQATPIWPPLTVPSESRARVDSASGFHDLNHRPSTLPELSTVTFRTRKWMQFSARPTGVSMRVGENVTTWATLPEECYTPTPQKPWQGIWCGDYAGHGCEFLVITQPDDPSPLPPKAELAMRDREREGSVASSDSWSTAAQDLDSGEGQETGQSPQTADDLEDSVAELQGPSHEAEVYSDPDCAEHDDLIYRGRLEAIKLTGDPNIPRGEYTFIAPDIGPEGFLRTASDSIFKGARIVKSVGHIAAHGFRNDDFMASQLILISPDRLAQYWETFGHVSFYERVNIDEFTKVI